MSRIDLVLRLLLVGFKISPVVKKGCSRRGSIVALLILGLIGGGMDRYNAQYSARPVWEVLWPELNVEIEILLQSPGLGRSF